MDFTEVQNEEVEVLASIFEGDENFNTVSQTCYQYKCKGEDPDNDRAFIVEVSWPEKYPEELPKINLDVFFNKQLPDSLKDEIRQQMQVQADALRGESMTYSLFDWIRENCQQFIDKIPDVTLFKTEEEKRPPKDNHEAITKVKKEKKEHLSKAQKRKLADQLNARGEKDRGWNWVDVVKHLSKTGTQEES